VSRQVRDKFGFIPCTILEHQPDKWNLPLPMELRRNVETKAHGEGTSVFPHDERASPFNSGLARFLLRYYCAPGNRVLDPFAGWGTRAYVASTLGMDYIGFDVAASTVEAVNKALASAKQAGLEGRPRGSAAVWLGDGCKCEGLPEESFDAILTSPPYADREIYEDCPREVGYQLSRVDRGYFEMFMRRAFPRWRALLKPGGFAVFVVGDWREDGGYYPFTHLMTSWGLEAGFRLHDQVIHKLSGHMRLGIGTYAPLKFLPRAHETALVFRK
jgi:tRNA G10  N-methylase Trm11